MLVVGDPSASLNGKRPFIEEDFHWHLTLVVGKASLKPLESCSSSGKTNTSSSSSSLYPLHYLLIARQVSVFECVYFFTIIYTFKTYA